MGKGQIISGGEDGKYQVKLLFSRENIALNLTALNARIVILEARIAGMPAGSSRDLVTLQKNALVKRIAYLGHMPEDETIEAWCGDRTEDLSGEVGTIEIPGERGAVNIRPGHEGAAAYNQGRDGQLQPAIASRSAATTFYNLAMLPGWQKWMPTFRYGTITSIDTGNDRCNVILETAKSSQQKLGVNHESTLIGVPIEYMTCNSAAFVVGDEVIVQFASLKTQAEDNWETAKVIGFKSNPRGCSWEDWNGPEITSNHPWGIRGFYTGPQPAIVNGKLVMQVIGWGDHDIFYESADDPEAKRPSGRYLVYKGGVSTGGVPGAGDWWQNDYAFIYIFDGAVEFYIFPYCSNPSPVHESLIYDENILIEGEGEIRVYDLQAMGFDFENIVWVSIEASANNGAFSYQINYINFTNDPPEV